MLNQVAHPHTHMHTHTHLLQAENQVLCSHVNIVHKIHCKPTIEAAAQELKLNTTHSNHNTWSLFLGGIKKTHRTAVKDPFNYKTGSPTPLAGKRKRKPKR